MWCIIFSYWRYIVISKWGYNPNSPVTYMKVTSLHGTYTETVFIKYSSSLRFIVNLLKGNSAETKIISQLPYYGNKKKNRIHSGRIQQIYTEVIKWKRIVKCFWGCCNSCTSPDCRNHPSQKWCWGDFNGFSLTSGHICLR